MRKKVINNVSTQPRLWTLSVRTNERPWCRLIEPTLPYACCTSMLYHYQPEETSSKAKERYIKDGPTDQGSPVTAHTARGSWLSGPGVTWGVWWPPKSEFLLLIFQDISSTDSHGHGHLIIISLNLLTLLFEDESQERAVFRWMVLPGPSENLPGLSKAHPSPQPRSPPSKLGPYPHTCLFSFF